MRPPVVLVVALLASCDHHPSSPPPVASVSPAASAPVAATATAAAPGPPPLAGGVPCGALGCLQFESPRDAFLAAIAGDARVVALGEAHAQKGATATSAAKRFTGELLPLLKGRASDLLVELMMPPRGCADAAAEVRQKQAPATSQQAPTNQNEYLAMGEAARGLG
ncbi:MAG: hypothetical protein ACRELB_03380, partial [Polyangiaceae bacterium]